MVEQRRRAVLLPEALDLLDDFRHRLQQSGENCLRRTTGTHTGVQGNTGPRLSAPAVGRQRHDDRLTYVRGLLGGGGCYEKLPLAAEALHHHLCLERGERRATETPAVSPTVDRIQNPRILPQSTTLKEDDKHVKTIINPVHTLKAWSVVGTILNEQQPAGFSDADVNLHVSGRPPRSSGSRRRTGSQVPG